MHRVRSTVLLAAVVGAAACASAPRPPSETRPFASEELAREQPADVAVLPVRDQSGPGGVPSEELRAALVKGLVDRFYSPLALEYVDRRWAEASTGGADPAAEALLQVIVTEWDTTHLETRGVVYASAEALLLRGADPEGPPLWGVTLRRRMRVAEPEGRTAAGALPWPVAGARTLAGAILDELPERDPVAAAR